jgi:putative flippase GtrA
LSSSPPAVGEATPAASPAAHRHIVSAFIVYVVGGGIATLIHLGVLYVLVEHARTPPTLATSAGFCIGTAFNYTFQYYLTFASTAPHGRTLVRYLAVSLLMLGVNALLFKALTGQLGLPYLFAQIAATGIVMLCNFTINRAYTFRHR